MTFASLSTRAAGASGNFSLAVNPTASENKIVLANTVNAPVDNAGSNNAGLFFGGTDYARYDTVNGYFRAVNYGSDSNAPAAVSGATMGVNDAAQDVKLNGPITAQTTASVNTLNLAANNLTLQDASQTLSVNGLLSAGAATASIATAGQIQPAISGGEILIRVNGSSDTLTIAPNIQNNASASALTKSGAGTLTLSGTNSYTGTTTINAGTLVVSGGAAIADAAAVVLANTAGALLQFNNSETIGNLSGGGFSGGNVNVQGSTLTFSNSASQTFGGKFIGNGAIIKQGSGSFTFSNPNTFAGTLTLNAGTLQFTYGNNGSSGTLSLSSGGAISMANGTTLNFNPTAQVAFGIAPSQLMSPNGWTVSNPINVTAGTGNLTFGGNDNKWIFSGGATGGTSGSQTLAITTGNGLDREDVLFAGVIANGSGGTLGLNVVCGANNSGTFVNLAGSNTFTGPISLSLAGGKTVPGILGIGGETYNPAFSSRAVSLGSGYLGGGNYTSTISLGTNTILDYLSSANQTLAGVISGGGSLLKEGSGTLTVSATNTYTGSTTITNGWLIIGGAGQLGGGAYSNSIAINNTNTALIYSSSANQTFAGTISGTGSLTKNTGTGTLTLAGTNTFTGPTTIGSGMLRATTGNGTRCASAVTVSNTAGCVFGVQLAAVDGQWASSTNLTLAGSSSELDIDYANLTPSTTTDPIKVLNLNVSGGGILKILGDSSSFVVGNTYPLINFTGSGPTAADPYTGLTLSMPAGATGHLVTVANHVQLVVDSVTSKSWNTGADNWDIGTPWVQSGISVAFNPGDTVYLADAAGVSGNPVITITGSSVSPAAVIMNTASRDYSIAGNPIDSGSLSVNAPGHSLTLSNANTYTGGTSVDAGTVIYANKNAFGTGTITLAGGTSLRKITQEGNFASLAVTNNLTLNGQATLPLSFGGLKDQWFSGKISGSGSLRITGDTRTAAFTGNNDFTGGVLLDTTSSAWILIGHVNSLGTGILTINATAGAQNQGLGASTALTAGSGVTNNIVINSGATLNLGGPVAAGNLRLSGVISGGGALNKQDVNAITVFLDGNNTYRGPTAVSTGTLLVNANSAAATNTVTVATNATFGGTGTVGGLVNYKNGARALFTVTPTAATTFSNSTYLTFTQPVFLTNTIVKVDLTTNLGNGVYVLATNYVGFTINGSLTFATNSGSLGTNGTGVVSVAGNNLILSVSGVTGGGSGSPGSFSGISVSGSDLTLSVTNGTPGGTWTLLESTNLLLPVAQWSTNRTGNYDGSGNLTTNIQNTATNPAAFYLLK